MTVSYSSDRSPNRERIHAALSETLRKLIFENRYVLHPSQIDEVVTQVANSVVEFSSSGNDEPVEALGWTLAQRGLSIESVMASIGALHEVHGKGSPISAYASALVSGYTSCREAEILTNQEQLRRALSSALETQSRELLIKNQAIDSSMNGIIIADMEGRIAYVNRSFLTMWGYDLEDRLEGKWIRDVWPDDSSGSIADRFTGNGEWRGEFVAKRTDGKDLTVSLSSSYIRNANGEAIGIMAFFVDITESKRLEIQMQQIQKMDDLGQLAGGIVHDFNNLLAAIAGYLQLVLLEAPSEGPIHRDLMQIKSAVDRGAGLTRQLAYFTRQASGKRELIKLNDVALETYELLKRTFPRDIELKLSLAETLETIEADPNQMSQVIMNLCVNARDAIVEKGAPEKPGTIGTVSIETANVQLSETAAKQYVDVGPGKYVELRVIDTGVGIDPQVRKHLFVPFVTTKNAASGTGLGLAVVYGIVRSHRGFIDLTSTRGVGTTFFVYLPVADSLPRVEPEAEENLQLVQGEGTLLIVDDDDQVREVITRTLKLCGYRVLEASSGRTAIECYQERGTDIDLVIIDMVMPEMNGQDTLTRLREMNPNLAALLMTGYTSAGRLGKLARSAPAQIVEKPIDLRLLTEQVKEQLSLRQ